MRKPSIALIVCVSLFTLSLLFFEGFVGIAAHEASTTCGSWRVVPSADLGPVGSATDELRGVSAASGSDVWAVGDGNITNNTITVAEHWNGSKWSFVPSLNVKNSGADSLAAVTELSAKDVWAVGSYYVQQGAHTYTLIEHWNGSQWRIIPSPNPGSVGNYLSGIAAISSKDIWAVGVYYDSSFINQTLVEHWDGSSWSVVASPNSGSSGSSLNSVSAISSSDVWAVGSSASGTTLTEHWNGSQWSIVSSPTVGDRGYLTSVTAISSGDVWAVGTSIVKLHHTYQTLIEQWNGSSWNVVPSPDMGIYANNLYGVAAVSANNIWAVGNYDKTGHEHFQSLIEQWNGSSWNVVPSPLLGHPNSNTLYAAAVIPGTSQLWTVGIRIPMSTYQYRTLTEYYC